MAQDTLLGFPAHTLPYRRGEFTVLSTVLFFMASVMKKRPPVFCTAFARHYPHLSCLLFNQKGITFQDEFDDYLALPFFGFFGMIWVTGFFVLCGNPPKKRI